jgi:hypothetical protein
VIVKYEIKSYGKERIVPINCVKETEKTLWIETERRGRVSIEQRRKGSNFHDTWQSAYDHLIATAQHRITYAKRNLQQAEADLAELETLSEPQPPVSRIARQPTPNQVP